MDDLLDLVFGSIDRNIFTPEVLVRIIIFILIIDFIGIIVSYLSKMR